MAKRSVVKMNNQEQIAITRFGNGSIACSLIEDGDIAEEVVEEENEEISKPTKTSSKSKTTEAVESADNPFNAGDNVLYDGKAFKVSRAYVYRGKPYCILSDKRQVSATKLTKTK